MSEEQSSINSNDLEEGSAEDGSRQQEKCSQNSSQSLQNGNNEPTQNSEVKQENPFSFKHFLKRDPSSGSNNSSSQNNNATSNNIGGVCHSRSTSIINGGTSECTPSKSATTSSLNQNHNTGARPKIPQFQSVHALGGGSSSSNNSAESKMKRSPRFPSFDSQSSLSELSDELKYNSSSLFHSRSNSSFNSDYPVQRSFSNYDIESPPKNNGGSPLRSKPNNHNSPGHRQPSNNRTGEYSAAGLPDFVQDHIVLEQWYHGLNSSPKSTSPVSVDFENLPDFTLNDSKRNNDHFSNRIPVRNPSPVVPPLDLPIPLARREQAPPDLPPDITEGQRGAFGYGGMVNNLNRDTSTDKIQTLPDFLSDGALTTSNNRLAVQDPPHFNSPDDTTISRLQAENDRLRNDLEESRQIIINQTCRISELEHLLQLQRNIDTENSRVVDGGAGNMSLLNKLKQQIKQLTAETESLRRENESLKEEGAVGGANVRSSTRTRNQQFSRDLRLAATSAENHLRQLLTGVDNLRIMAANLENTDRVHDPTDDFLSDDDENDFAGPAL